MAHLLKVALVGMALCCAPVVLPGRATAQTGPCADDLKKFCEAIQPGGGRYLKCLRTHEADLSVTCKTQLLNLKGERGRRWKACRSDAQKFCKNTRFGAIAKCLQAHETELSAECKAGLQRYQTP